MLQEPAPPPGFTEDVPLGLDQPEQVEGGPIRVNIVGDTPAAPEGFTEEIEITPQGEAAIAEAGGSNDLLDKIALGLKGFVSGLGDLGEFVNPGQYIANRLVKDFGGPDMTAQAQSDRFFDVVGAPDAISDTDKLIEATARGAGSAAPLGFGALVPTLVSGAAGGAASELTRQGGYGPMAQLAASVVAGGGASALASKAGNVRNLLPSNREPNELARAAKDVGVDLLPADTGGPTVRRFTSAASQGPISAAPITEAGQRVVAQAKAARDRIASASGVISTTEGAGEAARRGAEAYIKGSGKQGGRLYDQAAELAADTRIELTTAKQVLDDQIARMAEVPGGGEGIADAQALRTALDRPEGFSVQGVRDMRTELFVAPELRGGPAERRMRQVVDAASADVEAGLRAQGRADAADAFRNADQYWRDRLDIIDNVLKPILGGKNVKGGEDVYKAIEAATKGNSERLYRFMRALPEEDAGIVRATLIGRLGRSNKSAQNAEGDAFSLETFLTHWNELTPRSKSILFDGDYRKQIENLAKVSEASRQASAYANRSNTTGGIVGQTLISGALGAISLKTLGAALAGQYGAGKLLASRRFAAWLASAPKKPNAAATRDHIARLSAIGASEPAIANEVHAFQQRIRDALTQSPQPIAAQDKNDDR